MICKTVLGGIIVLKIYLLFCLILILVMSYRHITLLQLVKDLLNHQSNTAAEPANLITDWFSDDDLSDEEEDQQEDENLPSVVDTARQRQDRSLLSSSLDSYERSKSSYSDSDISNSSVGSNANGASTHLGKDKTVWKNSPTSVVGRTPAHNV